MSYGIGRILAAAVVAVGLSVTGAQAQERMVEGEMAGEAVKYRVNVMRAIGAHMGSIGAILQGKVENKGDLAAHGAALEGLAGMMDDLFPKGSGEPTSRLKAAFFEDKEQVAGIITALQEASSRLAAAAASGEMGGVGQNLGAMGQQCGACHKQYRAPQT